MARAGCCVGMLLVEELLLEVLSSIYMVKSQFSGMFSYVCSVHVFSNVWVGVPPGILYFSFKVDIP